MPTALPLSPRTARLLPWIIATAQFMPMLDGTILNTALPAMALDLAEDPLRMQSAVIAYMLSVAVLMPASGWIADRFGTRRVFLGSILLFTLGSLLCALSDALPQLVAARVLQGFGGAMMMPVGRLVVLRAYPRTELVRVLSFVTMPALLGPLLGPPLGGWLVEYASWHWIFLLNLPVGLLGCLIALRLIPDLRGLQRTRFDTPGFLLFGAAMLLISIALEGLGELHLPHARVMLLLLAGLACLAAYWVRATFAEEPLFSPGLFRTHSFAIGLLGNLFTRLGSGAMPFLTPLLLQLGLDYSPSKAGMAMVPVALSSMAMKPLAPRLIEHLGYRRVLVGNTLLIGSLLASLALVDGATPYGLLLLHLGLIGAVNSLQFSAMNTVALIDLPTRDTSSANSLLSVVVQLSMSLGVGIGAALLSGFSADGVAQGDSLLAAFQATYVCVGLLAMLGATLFFQLRPEDGRAGRSVEDELGE